MSPLAYNIHSKNRANIFGVFFAILLLVSLSASAQETSGGFSAGSVEIGYDNRSCSGTTEGNIRYNTTSNKMEFCNGSIWAVFQFDPCATSPASNPSSNNNAQSEDDYTAAFSYTVGTAGTERLLVVGVLLEGPATYSTTAVTFDGNSMTKVKEITEGTGFSTTISLWYLHVDDVMGSGSHTGNIAITYTGTPTIKMVTADYITNVNVRNPVGLSTSLSQTDTSISTVLPVGANTMTVDVMGISINQNLTPDNSQTELVEVQSTAETATMSLGTKAHSSAGNQTLGWSHSSSAREAIISAEIHACN